MSINFTQKIIDIASVFKIQNKHEQNKIIKYNNSFINCTTLKIKKDYFEFNFGNSRYNNRVTGNYKLIEEFYSDFISADTVKQKKSLYEKYKIKIQSKEIVLPDIEEHIKCIIKSATEETPYNYFSFWRKITPEILNEESMMEVFSHSIRMQMCCDNQITFFKENNSADYIQVLAITDGQAGDICFEDHKGVFEINYDYALPHFIGCRCSYSPLFSYIKKYKKEIEASKRLD